MPISTPVALETPPAQVLYRLRFKQGINCDRWVLFWHGTDLTQAIVRGRNHCETMNYKFLLVEPALVDLDAMEKRFTGS